jgi:hypothetical protein
METPSCLVVIGRTANSQRAISIRGIITIGRYRIQNMVKSNAFGELVGWKARVRLGGNCLAIAAISIKAFP